MTTQTETLTITLTDRAPVRIRTEDWPVLASARWHDDHRGIESQAIRTCRLTVRQHADGRTLVYGVHESKMQGESQWRGGVLLQAGADVARAIREVGDVGTLPDAVIRKCIADLPAVEI